MKTHLAKKLEERVEAVLEGAVVGLFAAPLHPHEVMVQLARALEDSAGGPASTPATRYSIRLNPADLNALLQAHPRLAETLGEELVQIAREHQLTLSRPPEVLLYPDPHLKSRQIVIAAEKEFHSPGTQNLTPVSLPSADLTPPAAAFLIIGGERTVPLNLPVLNIGRKLDNHLIVDDRRVSRRHAQLRLRHGRYVLYDLGSSGGTFVNDQRVEECVLQPGDVISLGGALLIYGEGTVCEVPKT